MAGLVTAGAIDGPASLARFNDPYGVAVDAAGNIYVADQLNRTIRKITAAGVVTTLAGKVPYGSYYIENVDGAGGAARFGSPQGIAVDAAGIVYVTDLLAHTIRKITPDGVVSTLAGAANIRGDNDGVGGTARFNRPASVAVDKNGNLYVAEEGNHTIRKITNAGVVSTLAGLAGSSGAVDGIGNAARFNAPKGVAVDEAGTVYVADTSNFTVRKISVEGVVSTFAGQVGKQGSVDGVASAAKLGYPQGIAVDMQGNVYVAQTGGYDAIRKISPAGVVTTFAGQSGSNGGSVDGVGTAARFFSPRALAMDLEGRLYVADTQNNRIRRITPEAVVSTVAGPPGTASGSDGVGREARFASPWAIAVNGAGTMYVADTFNYTVRKITAGGIVTTLAGQPGVFALFGPVNGVGGAAQFGTIFGITVDLADNVYVTESNSGRIRKIAPDGVVTTVASSAAQFFSPQGVVVDAAGNLYVATPSHIIQKVTPGGSVSTLAGLAGVSGRVDGAGSAARFTDPRGVAVDASGNIYVADTANHAIRKITPAGEVSTIAGKLGVPGNADGAAATARFASPNGVGVDAAGNIYVADSDNSTIRRIAPDSIVTTIAGKSTVYDGFTRGDAFGSTDGIGSEVGFNRPRGLAVDAAGHVYVADTYNELIRYGVLAPDSAPTFSSQPTNQTAVVGSSVVLAVGVTGNPAVSLRWQVSTDGGSNFSDIANAGPYSGATSATLTITGVTAGLNGNRYRCVATNAVPPDAISAVAMLTVNSPPAVATQPVNQTTVAGGSTSLTVAASSTLAATYQWQLNGSAVSRGTSATLVLNDVQPANAGLYTALVTNSAGSTTSDAAIVGVMTATKVIGSGTELQPINIVHPNGNTFDQVLLTGVAEAITADAGQATRTSFLDLNDDIVQLEFSGAGTLSLVLDNASGPTAPAKYNQPTASYMKGHAGIVITGADETTNVSIFSVGRLTAFDPTGAFNFVEPVSATNNPMNNGSPLFTGHAGTNYDGVADIAFIAISSANGKFGGLRASNASCFAAKGLTGIYAPGVQFTGPVFINDINASAAAIPAFVIGSSPDTRITGGDLLQANGQPVKVSGLSQLKFTAGAKSSGAGLPVQTNKGVLQQNGTDVTAQIVVNP